MAGGGVGGLFFHNFPKKSKGFKRGLLTKNPRPFIKTPVLFFPYLAHLVSQVGTVIVLVISFFTALLVFVCLDYSTGVSFRLSRLVQPFLDFLAHGVILFVKIDLLNREKCFYQFP